MRQGQQNNRRGRNNNRRHNNNSHNNSNKSQNMLTKSFDSNGPDVKIRGNAATIAEKYSALAYDAISAGSRIKAENYFQHAEHYKRIVSAAQLQQAEQKAAQQVKQAAQQAERAEQIEQSKAEQPNQNSAQQETNNSQQATAQQNNNTASEVPPSMITDGNMPVDILSDSNANNSSVDAPRERPKRPRRKPRITTEENSSQNDDHAKTSDANSSDDKPREKKPRKEKAVDEKSPQPEATVTTDVKADAPVAEVTASDNEGE